MSKCQPSFLGVTDERRFKRLYLKSEELNCALGDVPIPLSEMEVFS